MKVHNKRKIAAKRENMPFLKNAFNEKLLNKHHHKKKSLSRDECIHYLTNLYGIHYEFVAA